MPFKPRILHTVLFLSAIVTQLFFNMAEISCKTVNFITHNTTSLRIYMPKVKYYVIKRPLPSLEDR